MTNPEDRVIRFSDQRFLSQTDHGGIGLVKSSRARKQEDGVHCNFIDFVVVPPGASIGLHSHELDNEELYIIISGTGIMTIEDIERKVGEGDLVINPPGGTHGLRNEGSVDLKLVVVEYPSRQ